MREYLSSILTIMLSRASLPCSHRVKLLYSLVINLIFSLLFSFFSFKWSFIQVEMPSLSLGILPSENKQQGLQCTSTTICMHQYIYWLVPNMLSGPSSPRGFFFLNPFVWYRKTKETLALALSYKWSFSVLVTWKFSDLLIYCELWIETKIMKII